VWSHLAQDYYQIPIDPTPINRKLHLSSYGLRDGEREPDGYVTFSGSHFNPDTLLTVSPFYTTMARLSGRTNDFPVISTVTQTANYAGMQAALNVNFWKNDLEPVSTDSASTSTTFL